MSPVGPDDMIGRLIDGRYQVRSLIAKGGMATVYVATDLRLERRVAVKVMHDHLAADERFRERFIREARSAAKITHPNVVNVFDQGDDDIFAYMVMEYIPGITLRDLLHDHHKLTSEQAIDVMDAVLAGLQAAHKLGIVHRDLKPENVLLADDGRIKLSDFGLARAASANTASSQVLLGTIAYLSPELVTKGTADVRSDIYSLGIMLYEMLTGEQPYRGDQPVNIAYRHANETVPAPSDIAPEVPHELDELVAWATEKDPEARPADAGVMLDALRRAEAELGQAVGFADSGLTDARTAVLQAAPDEELEDTDPTQLATLAGQYTGPSAGGQTGEAQRAQPFLPSAATTTLMDQRPDDVRSSEPSLAGAGALPAATATVAKKARRRRGLGVLLGVLLVALVATAGVTGWWFGAGPGSYASVPTAVGLSQAEAEASIADAGFRVGEVVQENSLDIPTGEVMSIEPGTGTALAPNTAVTLTVSAGPEILTVPQLAGLALADAEAAIVEAGFTYDAATTLRQFSDDDADVVLSATDGNGSPLPTQMSEGQPIRLVASAGIIPNVAGETRANASETLEGLGLVVNVSSEEFSATVPAGVVIATSTTTDPVVPGDTINISVSKGPELVTVPDVRTKTVAEAIVELQALGFKVSHTVPTPELEKVLRVTQQNPAGGAEQTAPKGSTITLTASISF